MAYINTDTNEYPITEQDIQQQFPNTSFSFPLNPPDNFKWVYQTQWPVYDLTKEYIQEDIPVLNQSGSYEQVWKVISLDPIESQRRSELKRKNTILDQITSLENQVTQRRICEAVLGIDNGWLQNINQQISDLRVQL